MAPGGFIGSAIDLLVSGNVASAGHLEYEVSCICGHYMRQ